MVKTAAEVRIRPLEEVDIEGVVAIDEKIGGRYRPEVWEGRIGYYVRRDPESSLVAEVDGRLIGFMLGEVRSGEFGLEEPSGWIEVLGVDPDHQGRAVGRQLAEAMLESFRARGAKTVRTLVEADMEDIGRFFTSLGFEQAPVTAFVKRL